MNTPDKPVHQTLRILSRIAYITGIIFLIISLTLNFIPAKKVSATSGKIWTTRSTCIPPAPQDENHYTWGEEVFIRGSNFNPNTIYHWGITGQPGSASADPGIIVAAWYIAPGTVINTDADGYFCFKAYTIAPDDLGEYSVDVFEVGGTNPKNDNYHVDPAPAATLTDTPANTPTETPTETPTNTPTSTTTETPTETPTGTPTSTATDTPTNTPTATPTDTPTATPTDTPTNTPTATPTDTPTSTPTDTPTSTPTHTPTNTPTHTPTDTPTSTPTNTPTDTPTATLTNTEPPGIDLQTDTPEVPGNTTVTPVVAGIVDLGTVTPIPTLPQPAQPGNPPAVLIPATGADLSMPSPLANLQTVFGKLGLAMLGIGLVLQGLSRKLED